MPSQTDDTRIVAMKELSSPRQVINEHPITDGATHTVLKARTAIQKILRGEDDRLLVVVGPCSIHDPLAAIDYANLLQQQMLG